MKKLSTNDIRSMWIDFFKSKEHLQIESSSLIPSEDESLLWINSGVAGIKKYFEGIEQPPFKNLVNYQKSLRTNDLDNVGKTSRHQTFFEMLGFFSIGGYFKEMAILNSWDFFTNSNWIGFDPKKLYVTVYSDDKETYDIWKNKVGLSEDRIILGDKSSNFWEIGKGPCGPNTEIWYDRGELFDKDKIGTDLIKNNIENDRYIEVLNIVFSQYNNDGNGNYTDLPRKNIDTGAGLERIAAISQGATNNFDIDIFSVIIKAIQKNTENKYTFNSTNDSETNTHYKIIADHIRSAVFSISDGAIPSSNGRGYVIRRLIRRAIMSYIKLDVSNFLLVDLIDIVIESMKIPYPSLKDKINDIKKIISVEENLFISLIDSAQVKVNNYIKKEGDIDAKMAFYMFETYGFPYELINNICEDNGKHVDKEEFDHYFEKHQTKAREKVKKSGMKVLSKELYDLNLEQSFLGYESDNIDNSEILYISSKDLTETKASIKSGEEGIIVLNRTSFYAESGGQTYDIGTISNKGKKATVIKVEKGQGGVFLHTIRVLEGEFRVGNIVSCSIDSNRRREIEKNHSSTHILFHVLEDLLKAELPQAGSSNDEFKLRFDFEYDKKIDEDITKELSLKANKIVSKNLERTYREMDIEKAKKSGASYLKNEKYKDIVRVVSFGSLITDMCGGTHINNTSEIGEIYIQDIKSQGNGTYRLVAYSGKKQIDHYFNTEINKWKTELGPTLKKVSLLEPCGERIDSKIKLANKIVSELNDNLDLESIKRYVYAKDTLPRICTEVENFEKSKITNEVITEYSDKLSGIISDNTYSVYIDNIPKEAQQKLSLSLKSNSDLSNKIILVANRINDSKYSFTILKNDKFEDKLSLISLLKSKSKDINIRGGGNDSFIQGVSSVESIKEFVKFIKRDS